MLDHTIPRIRLQRCDDGVLVAWAAPPKVFASLVNSFKHCLRTGDVRYDPDARAWRVPRHSCAQLHSWLGRMEATHGCIVQRNAFPPAVERRAGVADAAATLCIRPDAPLTVAEAAYRALVKTYHPDHGGQHERAVAVNAAIATLRRHHAGGTLCALCAAPAGRHAADCPIR